MLRWFQNKNSTYTESLGPYGARETIALLLYTSPKKKIVNQLITSSPPDVCKTFRPPPSTKDSSERDHLTGSSSSGHRGHLVVVCALHSRSSRSPAIKPSTKHLTFARRSCN